MPILFKKPLSRLAQIEITLSLIIIIIIAILVTMTYHNRIKQSQDIQHKQTVNNLSLALEQYYLKDGRGFYPPPANLQDSQWMSANITKDYGGISIGQNKNNSQYVYTSLDASEPCQNPDLVEEPTSGCASFKLSATLSNSAIYSRQSHNGL